MWVAVSSKSITLSAISLVSSLKDKNDKTVRPVDAKEVIHVMWSRYALKVATENRHPPGALLLQRQLEPVKMWMVSLFYIYYVVQSTFTS